MFVSLKAFLARRTASNWAVLLLLLIIGGLAGHFLARGNLWVTFRAQIYQALTTFGHDPRHPQRTATVLLDDDDFWSAAPTATIPGTPPGDLAGRVPTNRAYLARILSKLDAAGASVVALDIDLRSPSASLSDFPDYTAENDELFDAIRQACAHNHKVVLASVVLQASDGVHMAPNIYDSAKLDPNCVIKGYVQLPHDIRRVPVPLPLAESGEDALPFALAAVGAVDPLTLSNIQQQPRPDFPYSQFLPMSSFEDPAAPQYVFSGREILAAKPEQLAPRILTRIVLVGGDWQTLAAGQGPYVDRHPSPGGSLPGVLLQANYIEAALAGKLTRAVPDFAGEAVDACLVLIVALISMLHIHAALKWSAFFLTFLFVVIFSYFFLQTFGLFLDFFFPLIILSFHALYEHFEGHRHHSKMIAKE